MSIFGAVTDEKEMSVKAKWLRKKYMGCGGESPA
jgi:hypothetical protein